MDSSRPDFWDTRYRDGVTPGDAAVERARKLALPVRKADFFALEAPPFGISMARLHELLDAAFTLEEDEAIPPEQSVPVLSGKERWQVRKRRL